MSNPKVRLRKASMADVAYIEQIEHGTFGKSLGNKMFIEDILYNHMAHYQVLEVAGERAGYCSLWLTMPYAEIIQIIVEPPYRHQGYGRLMMDAMLEKCEKANVEAVTLEVRVTNTQAINFYEQFGFKTVSRRKRYYQDGEDAWLMMKARTHNKLKGDRSP